MGTWHFLVLSAGKPHAHKIPLFRGGVGSGLFRKGGVEVPISFLWAWGCFRNKELHVDHRPGRNTHHTSLDRCSCRRTLFTYPTNPAHDRNLSPVVRHVPPELVLCRPTTKGRPPQTQPQPFLSSSRGTPFFNFGVPLDDASNASSTQ